MKTGSVFWNTAAVDADIHLFSHSSVQVAPLMDMLKGSISFASPNPDATQVKSGAEFTLFSSMPDSVTKADKAFETQKSVPQKKHIYTPQGNGND